MQVVQSLALDANYLVDIGRRAMTVGVSQQESALINYGVTSFLFAISVSFYNSINFIYEVYYLLNNFMTMLEEPRLLLI